MDAPYLATADLATRLDPQCPDVYFTSGYGEAASFADAGTWQVACWPGRALLPHVVRPIAEGTAPGVGLDAASPYGYAGLHVSPGCTPADLARFWDDTVELWRDCGVVSVFLRFSPLDPGDVEAVRGLPMVVLTRRGETIRVDVSTGPAGIWADLRGRARTAIRKARAVGLEGAIRPAGVEDVTVGGPFRRLYAETMLRVGATAGYLFSDEYFRLLATGLGKRLLIAEVRQAQGIVVAAALVMLHGTRAHYHLAGSDPSAARSGANNLLVWTILCAATERGCDVVHLGGGVRGEDGLFRFKQSFGGERATFWTGNVVVDPGRYAELVRTRAGSLGRSVAEVRDSSFFPAYRSA